MRILLLTHAFNSLAQRLFVELRGRGHDVTVELDINDAVTREAVELVDPDLVIAPFLKRAIPEDVWRQVPCFIVHPGIRGDRGPSSLDWAILDAEPVWGVTVLQAEAEMDAGPVWASCEFPMRDAAKSSLYRNEVTEAAVVAVLEAVDRFTKGGFAPERVDPVAAGVRGRARPAMRQADRAIDWSARHHGARAARRFAAPTATPASATSCSTALSISTTRKPAAGLDGPPGAVLARSGPAIARATIDGAVWIGHLREPAGEHPFKLPATLCWRARSRGCPPFRSMRRPASARLPTARPAPSACFISTSTTAPWAPRRPGACLPPIAWRPNVPPRSSCCLAAPSSGPTAWTST